jgi:putative transposase
MKSSPDACSGRGLTGEPVREMLIEAVEKRFGDVDAGFGHP